jgi:hypothetical protein
MEIQSMNLNIRYDLPSEVWEKTSILYTQLEGWKGYGKGNMEGEKGIPYWFGYENDKKWISASVEPSSLYFEAKMKNEEWEKWVKDIKMKATQILGFKVGEIELGEVGHEIEWLHDRK